jgi:heat shock protein HslJ
MNKSSSIMFGGFAVLIIVIAAAAFIRFNYSDSNGGTPVTGDMPSSVTANDPKDIAYMIDGESIPLRGGTYAREAAPGSASQETFTLFGEPTLVDLDGDGDLDAVSYLNKNSGGTGVFFYVVAAVNTNGTYKGTNAMFLGDRIAPQNINVDEGNAVANFAERKPGEAFTVQPSVGKSVWIHLDPKTGEIGELVKDFEGEADTSKMTLTMKTWNWVRTDNADGSKVLPKKADTFTLTFKKEGTFSAKTDCNGVGGEYKTSGSALSFEKMMSTLMFCEGSQEQEYSSMITAVSGYHFTGKGELILELKDKKGTATFR